MNKLISTDSRIVLGLIIGILMGGCINAQNQISDEDLIALAKQTKGSINSNEFFQFYEKFMDSIKKIYIPHRIQWYQDHKEDLKQMQGKSFNEKEWNPKKFAERDWNDDKSRFELEKKHLPQITPQHFSELIREILSLIFYEGDPRKPEFKQQFKKWLEKY